MASIDFETSINKKISFPSALTVPFESPNDGFSKAKTIKEKYKVRSINFRILERAEVFKLRAIQNIRPKYIRYKIKNIVKNHCSTISNSEVKFICFDVRLSGVQYYCAMGQLSIIF